MAGNKLRWIIRDASGRIDGPFTTEKVLYKIGRGEFSGDESIAHYPDGKWIAISQDPQFYDKLLEVLSKDPNREAAESTRVLDFTRPHTVATGSKSLDTTDPGEPTHPGDEDGEDESTAWSIRPPPVPEDTQGTKTGNTRTQDIEEPITESVRPHNTSRARRERKKPEDIELVDTRPQVWRETFKRIRVPLIILAVGVAFASVLYVNNAPTEERIHLLAPQKNVPQVNLETLKARIRQAVGYFTRDTFDGYARAQNDLVHIIEQSGKSADMMALLCMTYMQLWPYAYQDSSDTKAFATLVQMSSAVDPAGIHSATCRTADLIVRARFQEASSLVDAMLNTPANERNPPIIFYYLKGYLYEGSGEHTSAIGYLRTSEQLWPQWLLPYVTEAQVQTKLEHYSEAGNLYRGILKSNPDHAVARIELGLLEYKYFNHFPQGEQYLKQALDGGQAPRSILSRGYFGLAEISLQRGDQRRALKYAQRSFSLNSSFTPAKNLIVQLGGMNELRGTELQGQQLVFEGDQFFREGDCHAAQAHYKAAFDRDPKNATAALKAAQCLWKMSFSTEAIEWLNRAIRADDKLIEAYVTMAEYQAIRYNFLAATRILEAAKAKNPRSAEVYRGFAIVELKRGNAAGALQFGRQALKLYENDVETQILMAQVCLALKEKDKVQMAYNYAAKAIEIDVNNRKAQIVYAQAIAGLKGVDAGVDYMLKLVDNYSQVNEYRLALGKMLLLDERYQQAEEIFRQVIKLNEKEKDAYIELAKALRSEGSNAESLDLLLKAAVLDPADAEPLYLAGTIYLELRRPQEAAVQFQRVLTINKMYPLVHYQLGRAALLMNDPREALAQTDLEKRANPNLADAYLLAAEAHTLLQQYTNCATEYQQALKLRPQQASIYIKVAQCYRKKGDLDAATAMLNVAATKESGLADIYKEQGAIFEVKGDVVHAITSYQQYFTLDPDAPDREQIEARISALQRGQTP